MGFQINGVEYINSSGEVSNGFKTANSQSITGTGNITTGPSQNTTTYGATFNSVGSFLLAFVTTDFYASGNYNLTSGTQRRGIEQGTTIAGSGMYNPTYSSSLSDYVPWEYPNGMSNGGPASSESSHGSGTWRALCGGFDDHTWTWHPCYLFIRIS